MHEYFFLGFYTADQPRRSRIVYAVLKNEMTVSAEYWALRYHILDYVRVLPELSKWQFDGVMKKLVSQGAVQEVDPGMYIRTAKGADLWRDYQKEHYELTEPTMFVQYNVTHFAQVMLLVNQVISEWSYGNKSYYPMQINQQHMAFVKQWFQNQDKTTLVNDWLTMTSSFLSTLDDEEANRFVSTWSGHDVIGLTSSQLDVPTTWTDWDAMMWQRDMYAKWLHYLEEKNEPLLSDLIMKVSKLSGPLTKVQRSLAGLNAGFSDEEIAQQQQLRTGTIREHLLTAAIWLPMNEFPYDVFLTEQVKTYFDEKLSGPIDSWRFTTVRLTDDPYEFQVFRLYQIWLTKQEEYA